MKKTFSLLVLILLVSASLFASVAFIGKANPQLLYDNFPQFDLGKIKADSEEYKNRGFYTTIQDVYYRYFDRDSFFDIGFRVDDEHVNIVFDIDLRQTLNSFYRRTFYSNLPYKLDTLNDILDLNFPRYAYGEASLGKFYISLGRRPISWGPGKHQLAISGEVPSLDNIWADYKTELKSGTFNYNYVYICMNKLALRNGVTGYVPSKSVAAHRVGWSWDSFRFSIGELNLIYGDENDDNKKNRYPDLVDINPFSVYHNLYQDGSNVMAFFDIEGLINLGKAGKIRLFGEFVMDDFSLPTEGKKGKPTAFGVGGGLQWHVLDGQEATTLKDSSELYKLSSETFEFKSGLNFTYEIYFCNPYIYNRDSYPGKFTVPLYTDGESIIREPNAMYLGFKYGLNSLYQEVRADYCNANLEASLSLGLLVRGDGYTLDSLYGQKAEEAGVIDYNSIFKLYGNKMATILLNAEAAYLYAPGLQLEASLEAAFDLYNKKNAVCITLGHRIDLMQIK